MRKTGFTDSFIRENGLEKTGFREWAFCPGMLFKAPDKWWGHQGKRERPHEGLDLCLYRDGRDEVLSLHGAFKIPVLYDGRIVKIIDDFIGRSMIIEHDFGGSLNSRFYTIYGHTNPLGGLHIGGIVKQGDVIATLAEPAQPKNGLRPHLHLSLGWASQLVAPEKLNWNAIGASNTLVLLDPLHIIDAPYVIYTGSVIDIGRMQYPG